MTAAAFTRRTITAACCLLLTTGCSFQGLNSLSLPGTVGRGTEAISYRVELANVSTLESNSPVLIDDVVVGHVGTMTFDNWHANVTISVRPDVIVPANAVAAVGQTSLLGSMHLALDPPVGQAPTGRLQPGSTIGLNSSSTYPSTEQTLSSLSTVVNGGGLGQIGDIIHNFNTALSGRQGDVRDVLTRLNDFVGTFDAQREAIVASLRSLQRLTGTFAAERDVISRALDALPPALEVLVDQRPQITTALDKLAALSRTSTQLVNDTQADLVRNLTNLEPTIKALADVGPELDKTLAYATTFPFSQSVVDRAVKGDYMNLFVVVDFTYPRIKRTLLLGTRWGEEGARLIPAPGEPWYQNYTYSPLAVGITPAAPASEVPPPEGAPPVSAPASQPLLPVVPPAQLPPPVAAPAGQPAPIFAGPYGPQPATAGGR